MKINRMAMIGLFAISTGHAASWLDACDATQRYQANWERGIDPRLRIEAPVPLDIETVPFFHRHSMRNVLKVTIRRDQDFSHVANGTPRAEVSFSPVFRFENGKEYEIRWSTLLPDDYVFDTQQPEIITQLHQGESNGSPPFSLSLVNQQYQVDIRGEPGTPTQTYAFGNAARDRGKRVFWTLRYRPDDNPRHAATDLYRNHRRVVHSQHTANALAHERGAYFKIGIYKWWWKTRPSDVSERTIYYGNVEIKSIPTHRCNTKHHR